MPSNRICPAVASARRSTRRAVVDLPEPNSPTRARVRPWWRVRLTSSTARRVRGPSPVRGSLNSLTRLRTSTSGAVRAPGMETGGRGRAVVRLGALASRRRV
ncbi:hypothetical protein GCM10009654_25460 [Streptomyces hebeiensis]|uniref:Uncharacterized protein n=1 Tax=Streptomyces hebeiensis TaxID=229486 RepID=A0ABN1UUH3_9ACTN